MHNECHFLVIITSAVLFLQLIITLPFFLITETSRCTNRQEFGRHSVQTC